MIVEVNFEDVCIGVLFAIEQVEEAIFEEKGAICIFCVEQNSISDVENLAGVVFDQ